jgi:hypothetical protein
MAINFNHATNNITADSGSVSLNGAVPSSGGSTKTISNKTGAYTVVAGDLGSIINCTANSFTVSLTAAATLGAGFTCTIWNTSNISTDAITIDPNASETIDAKSVRVLRIGEGLDIVCDGTNWEISYKKTMRGYTENYDKNGDRPVASGDGATAIGYQTTASAVRGVAIGANSNGSGSVATTGAGAMALGGSYASGTDSFAAAILSASGSYGATGANSVAIGYQNKSMSQGAIAIGYGNVVTAMGGYPFSLAIGFQNTVRANCIVLGTYNNIPNGAGDDCIAIGGNHTNNTHQTFNFGLGNTTTGAGAMALGWGVSVTSAKSTGIGMNSGGFGSVAITGQGAMALGGSYASGTDSFAAGIGNNSSSYGATGGGNSIAMGFTAKTTSTSVYCGIAIGSVAYQNSIYGGIAIGYHTLASGSQTTAIGYYASATADYATAIGGANATAAQSGKIAFGSASGSIAQAGKIVLIATVSSPAVVLTSDGGAASTTNQLIVATGQSMAIQGTLIAKQSGNGNIAAWNITGAVSNNGGTLTSTGLALTLIGTDSIGLVAPTISLDTTNKAVKITSGSSGASTRYVATLNTSEVTYA